MITILISCRGDQQTPGVCEKNKKTPFMWVLSQQSGGRNCSPPRDAAVWKPAFPCASSSPENCCFADAGITLMFPYEPLWLQIPPKKNKYNHLSSCHIIVHNRSSWLAITRYIEYSLSWSKPECEKNSKNDNNNDNIYIYIYIYTYRERDR